MEFRLAFFCFFFLGGVDRVVFHGLAWEARCAL